MLSTSFPSYNLCVEDTEQRIVFQKPQQLVLTTAPLTCDFESIFVSSQYFL